MAESCRPGGGSLNMYRKMRWLLTNVSGDMIKKYPKMRHIRDCGYDRLYLALSFTLPFIFWPLLFRALLFNFCFWCAYYMFCDPSPMCTYINGFWARSLTVCLYYVVLVCFSAAFLLSVRSMCVWVCVLEVKKMLCFCRASSVSKFSQVRDTKADGRLILFFSFCKICICCLFSEAPNNTSTIRSVIYTHIHLEKNERKKFTNVNSILVNYWNKKFITKNH